MAMTMAQPTAPQAPGAGLAARMREADREELVEALAYQWAVARSCADMRHAGTTATDAHLAALHEGSINGILHVANHFGIHGREIATRGRKYLETLAGVQ